MDYSSCDSPWTRGGSGSPSRRPHIESDDYYLRQMRTILHASPQTGPPLYPIRLLDHVYIGNQRNADNIVLLQRLGITHVLNCAGMRRYDFTRSPYPPESGVKGFLMFSAMDHESYDITRHFDDAVLFLDRVKKSKGKALVHCNMGVNRSGAIVAAYLMVDQRQTLLQVTNYLKLKRFVILTNKGFRQQLLQFARSRNLLDPVFDNDEYCTDDSTITGNVDSSTKFLRSLSLLDSYSSQVDRKDAKPIKKFQRSWTIEKLINNTIDLDGSWKSKYRSLPRKSESKDCSFSDEGLTKARRSVSASRNTLPTVEITFSLEPKEPAENVSVAVEASDTKTRLKPSSNLSPVLEKNSETSSTTSSPNKYSGFWTLLGSKRKPTRSTSYSNVPSSVALSSTANSSVENSVVNSDDSSMALSTSRPLRLYKRSSTDSEVYKVSKSQVP